MFTPMASWRFLDEAALETGVSRRTLNRWIATGLIQVYRVPGDRRRMVDLDDVRKLRQPKPVPRPDEKHE